MECNNSKIVTFYIVHLYGITQQLYFNKKVNSNVKKNKENKLYKYFLPTLEQILDLLFFLHRVNEAVNQSWPGQVLYFASRVIHWLCLAYLIMENHSVSFLQVK